MRGAIAMLRNARITPVLPTRDLERARDFYTEKLGLKELPAPMEGLAAFEGGTGTRVYLFERHEVKPAEHTVAGFEVEDVVATVDGLRKHGVKFEEYNTPDIKTRNGIADMGGSRTAWFRDPDGHFWAVNEIK